MPISIKCPDCFRGYKVPEKYAGRAIRCKSCEGVIRVPAAPAASASRGASGHDSLEFDDGPSSNGQAPSSRPASIPSKEKGRIAAKELWIPIAGAFGFLMLVALVSMLTPISIVAGIGLLGVGFVVMFAAQIILVVVAFGEDSTQGLLVLFVPVYPLIYMATRWPQTQRAFQVMTIGLLAALMSPLIIFGGLYAGVSMLAEYEPSDNYVADDSSSASGDAAPGIPGGPNAGAPPMPPGMPPGAPPMSPPPYGAPPGFGPPPGFQPPPGPNGPGQFAPGGQPGRGGGAPAGTGPVETHTVYFSGVSHSFDPADDHQRRIETAMASIADYQAGSAELDLDEGSLTFKSTGRRAVGLAPAQLIRLGFRMSYSGPDDRWANPTIRERRTFKIERTNPMVQQHEQRIDAAADEAIMRFDRARGYIPGSVKVDLEGKTVSLECYPNLNMTHIRLQLASVGIQLAREYGTD